MQVKGGCYKTAESHGDIQITQTRQITAENRTETNSQSSGKLDIKTMQISGGQMGTDLHTSIQADIKATQNIAESCTCANASGNDHLLASQSNSTAQVGKDLHITSYQESGNTGAIEESQSKTEEFCGYLYVHTGHVAGKSRTETTSSSSGISMETEMSEQNRVDIDSNLHSSGQLDVKSAPVSGESSMGTGSQSKSLDIETSHKTTEGRKQTDTNSHSNQIDIKGTSENYIGTDSHSSRQLDVKVMHLSGKSHTETNLHGSGQLNIRSTQNTSENRTETELCRGVYRDAGQQISRAQAEKELRSTDHNESKTTVDEESQLEVDAFGGSLDTQTNQSSCESRTETKTVSSEQSVKTVQFGDESRTTIDAHSSSQLDAGVMQISGDRNSGTDLQSSSKLDVKSMQITSESHIDADTHNIQFNVRTTEISGECNKGTGTQSGGQFDMKTTQIGKERTTADFHSSNQHDIISAEHTGLTGTNSQNTNQLDIKTTQTDEKHCTGSCGSVQLQIKTTQVSYNPAITLAF
ncbi:unnamed protein product [Cylicostephanus goldi]|uniref:Uncharacterized protein n=1 Tax=Cylicostephanus goldi TaxID=71465 RepID=A0A3P6R324_CYLGO|nr:unnamed protein product [Cylicostephanus goldi]